MGLKTGLTSDVLSLAYGIWSGVDHERGLGGLRLVFSVLWGLRVARFVRCP
ncbi:hypothetical protein IscW_ISCW018090 [Ixodes scapularis]|uniref:Uncharacterized protein n=1 Tax=Ixodes scapularis TaxID=6945 RepID=B7PEG4_IXOSC|nr:hypothetical protein IscW_ISCW018090 [Ixodes scapularis]|eukprot:XP_002433586.1 hypothetical protein IscW_ISCW018090 [Ixodes scapularis]